jgi:hypothetical protein
MLRIMAARAAGRIARARHRRRRRQLRRRRSRICRGRRRRDDAVAAAAGGLRQEEIEEAQRLGTYEISIVPDEDCCTLFTPRFHHPGLAALLDAAKPTRRRGAGGVGAGATVVEARRFPKLELVASESHYVPGDHA